MSGRTTRRTFNGFWDFACVVGSLLSGNKTVQITINEVDDQPLGDQELWGNAAILHRPSDPDADGTGMEVLYFRTADELVAFASRDVRFQASLAKGEAMLRATVAGGGTVAAKINGQVHLSGEADFLARADRVLTQLSAMVTSYNGHTHLYVPGTLAAVITATPIPQAATPTTPATDKVKGT